MVIRSIFTEGKDQIYVRLAPDHDVELENVSNGVLIRTKQGHFGICERNGGIEVMLNGKLIWSSQHGIQDEESEPSPLRAEVRNISFQKGLNKEEDRQSEPVYPSMDWFKTLRGLVHDKRRAYRRAWSSDESKPTFIYAEEGELFDADDVRYRLFVEDKLAKDWVFLDIERASQVKKRKKGGNKMRKLLKTGREFSELQSLERRLSLYRNKLYSVSGKRTFETQSDLYRDIAYLQKEFDAMFPSSDLHPKMGVSC